MPKVIIAAARLLPRALSILESQTPWVFSYEDLSYEALSQLDPNLVHPMYENGRLMLREKDFSFSLPESNIDIEETLVHLLSNLSAEYPRPPFEFKRSSGYIFNIYPADKANRSVGDTVLTITKEKESLFNILKDFCEILSIQTGLKVYLGCPRDRSFDSISLSIDANNVSAREILNSLAFSYTEQTNQRLTWKIIIDPNPKGALALTVKRVGKNRRRLAKTTVSICATRPLSTAALILNREFNACVTYEEPRYRCPCQVMRDSEGQPKIPSGGQMEFSISEIDGISDAIVGCLNAFDNTVRSAKFSIFPSKGNYNLVPVNSIDSSQEWRSYSSILGESMSLAIEPQSGINILSKFCTAISSISGIKVVPGRISQVAISSHLVFNKQPIRTCLDGLVKEIGEKFSWQLLHDPLKGHFVLQIVDSSSISTAFIT